MVEHKGRFTTEALKAMSADNDLSAHMLGALIRLQFVPDGANTAEMSRHGVTMGSIHRLAQMGWVQINADYRINPLTKQQSWMSNRVTVLTEKDHSMAIWMVLYKRKGKSKKIHAAIFSARNERDAQEQWQHAWQSHQFISARCIEADTQEQFDEWAIQWMLPAGRVSIPTTLIDRQKYDWVSADDDAIMEYSKLLREDE